MADNVTITQGSGTTIATEDVGGVQHQKMKVEFGADGVANMVSASDPLPVVQTGTPELPTGAATAANQQSDALTNTELRATPVPVSGTFYQATQPVSIATAPVLVAGTALIGKVSIDQVTANANEVVTKTGSVTAATLSAETTKVIGTVNIAAAQTLATVTTVGAVTAITNALPAGTNNIGDVDVLSVPRSQSGPGQPGTAIDSYTQAVISAVTGANQPLIAAPGANKQIWVYGIQFTCTVSGTVALQDNDDNVITGVINYNQYSGPHLPPTGNFSMPLYKVATNKALEADVTTATINGAIQYAIVSV